jgi:SAM-dependent methyltransferase
MTAAAPLDATARLLEHRQIWASKPVLAAIYGVWFDAILSELPRGARVLEVGAGPGFLAEHARRARPDLRWLSSDLLPTPWNDVAANALRLPVRASSVDAVVGLDFIHHLAHPADFFRETARVLVPGGRVVAVEPWITPLSYPVYRFLHHELCRVGLDPWDAFPGGTSKDAFDGDSALVSALARRTPAARWREFGLEPPQVRTMNAFAYLMSFGFKRGSLLPASGVPAMLWLDQATGALAPGLGLRARLVWMRTNQQSPR